MKSSHKHTRLELVTKHDVQEGLIRICNLGHLREVSQHWLSELHSQLLLKFFSFEPQMDFCFIHVTSVLSYCSFGIRQRVCVENNFHASIKFLLYSFTFAVSLYP